MRPRTARLIIVFATVLVIIGAVFNGDWVIAAVAAVVAIVAAVLALRAS